MLLPVLPYTDPNLKLFNIGLFFLMVWLYLPRIYYRGNKHFKKIYSEGIDYVGFYIMVVAFSTFAFTNGDFYGYAENHLRILFTHRNSHLEDIYYWIICNVTSDYIYWRIVVWGVATFLMCLTIKRLRLFHTAAFLSITLFYLTTFYIMRGSLGVAIMFYGLTLYIAPSRHHIRTSKFLGCALMIVSYFFHRSMLLSLVLIPLSFFKPTKSRIKLSLLLFPVCVILVSVFFNYILENDFDAVNEDFSENAKSYTETAMFEKNWKGYIRDIIFYAPSYVSLFLITKETIFRNKPLPFNFRIFFVYWYLMVYVATIMLFQETGGWYYSRFMYMSNFPFAIVLAYWFSERKNSKFTKIIIGLGILANTYTLLYAFYNALK